MERSSKSCLIIDKVEAEASPEAFILKNSILTLWLHRKDLEIQIKVNVLHGTLVLFKDRKEEQIRSRWSQEQKTIEMKGKLELLYVTLCIYNIPMSCCIIVGYKVIRNSLKTCQPPIDKKPSKVLDYSFKLFVLFSFFSFWLTLCPSSFLFSQPFHALGTKQKALIWLSSWIVMCNFLLECSLKL